jgi:hypothetical protein
MLACAVHQICILPDLTASQLLYLRLTRSDVALVHARAVAEAVTPSVPKQIW